MLAEDAEAEEQTKKDSLLQALNKESRDLLELRLEGNDSDGEEQLEGVSFQ